MANLFEALLGDTLTRVVFLPTLAALPLLFLGRMASETVVKRYTLVASLVQLFVTGRYLLGNFDAGGLVEESATWIERFGIDYRLTLDGIAMPLVALTAFLLPIVILGSWSGIQRHWAGFGASMLILTTGIQGALLASDLFLFYIFWEVMLIPMYLLIGIWGGERRIYAAVKFFLYTMVGSLLMLLAIIWLAWNSQQLTGEWSFGYTELLRVDLPMANQCWLFLAFALAFAIKVPLFPFHTWLPDAHVEAPTGGSVILAGVLLKLGTYGLLRFAFPLFPHAGQSYASWIIVLSVIGILYGALIAWVQEDMKRLVAYSSVAHLGFVTLGIASFDLGAWQGALLQMVNHGLSTGALFLLVGMLYDRRHTKLFAEFGGLARPMPVFAFFLVFSTLASVGLPGLNGFVGEFMILLGTYRSGLEWPAILATFGVILAAVYLLRMLLETLWGPIRHDVNRDLPDLVPREILALVALCLPMLVIGVSPSPFLEPSRPALERTLRALEERLESPPPAEPRLRERRDDGGAP